MSNTALPCQRLVSTQAASVPSLAAPAPGLSVCCLHLLSEQSSLGSDDHMGRQMKTKTQECSTEPRDSPQDDEDTEKQPKCQASSSYQEHGQGYGRRFLHWGCGRGGNDRGRKGRVKEGRREGRKKVSLWLLEAQANSGRLQKCTVTAGDCTTHRLIWADSSWQPTQGSLSLRIAFLVPFTPVPGRRHIDRGSEDTPVEEPLGPSQQGLGAFNKYLEEISPLGCHLLPIPNLALKLQTCGVPFPAGLSMDLPSDPAECSVTFAEPLRCPVPL